MKKFSTIIGGVLCIGALAVPSVGWADAVKEKAVYTYGDAMGAVPEDVWSKYDHNFFDKDGKIVRSVQLSRSVKGDVLNINTKTAYIYNEAGKVIEAIKYQAQATSPDNVDGEFIFNINQHDVWEYNEAGQLTSQYYQQWNKSKGEWNSTYKLNCYEYTYNTDGTVAVEKFWTNQMSTNLDKPSRTTTYEYDAYGKVLKTSSVGQYESNCYNREYTYDTQGHLIHTVSTGTLEGKNSFGRTVEEIEYTYNGDFLTEVYTTTFKYSVKDGNVITSTTEKKTEYEIIENNPNRYYERNYTYNASTEKWARKATFTEHVHQDYAGMEQLIPSLSVSVTEANPQDMLVKFTLPNISYDNYAVRVYRDGAEIKTYTKDELTTIADGSAYSFTDSGLKSGEHEYYAQLLVGDANQTVEDMNEGYISDIATAKIVIDYPEVTDFKIKGYTLTKTWVPESEEDGETVGGVWQEVYKMILEWTPLTEEQVAGYGFERYEIHYKSVSGNISADVPVENIADIATGTAEVDWLDRYTEVWLTVKYGEDRVETAHLPIDISKLTNLSAKDPIPAYGVINYSGYTPAFVKVDLTKPEEAGEMVYNLYDDSYADWSGMFGGVSVGDSYYALYEDAAYGDIYLGAFDMTNKKYAKIGNPYTSYPESSFSDLLYDSASDKMYAVVPEEGQSSLYAIDRTNGTATKTDIALPEYTLYLATAESGKAYAMAAETGKFQLYSVDLNAGTYTKVDGVTVEGKQNKWSSLVYTDNTLYFNLNTKFFTINLTDNKVTVNNDLKNGLSGITFTASTALPELVPTIGEYSHMIVTEKSAEGTTNYYYSPWNQLERISEFDAEGNMTKYTKNIVNEAGMLTTTEVYEPSVDEYGIKSMQVSATSTYSYTDEGLLSSKTNSDGTWERRTYENGLIATETFGNGETTEKTLTYMYDDMSEHPDKPVAIMSTSDTDENANYTAMFGYDAMGNTIGEYHVKDMMAGEYLSFETWEYFPNTNIVSAHNICVPNQFDEQGNPVVERSTKYMPVGDGYDHLMSQEIDGNGNPIEGTAKDWGYSDLTDTAEMAYVQATATEVEGSTNDVAISFGVPGMAYIGKAFSLGFYRDGQQIGELSLGEILTMQEYVFTDKQVPNGKHEYFVRTNEIDDNDNTIALQISPIVDLELNTELPIVSDIKYVKYEEAFANANGEIDDNATSGDKKYLVTIGWNNPEIPEAYGFTDNHIFLIDGEKPVEASVVEDGTIAETVINVGSATTFNVMIQSRYALGVANSETTQLSFTPMSVDNISDGGFNLMVEDKSVIASEDATINVFSADGTRVAAAYGSSLDLSALNGTYVVTAERNGEIRIVKVIL